MRSLRQMPLLGAVVRGISHLFLPNVRIWTEVQGGVGCGLRLRLNPRYDEGFWLGNYEEGVQAVLAKYLKPGFVVYDLGAHIGFLSLIAARLVGPKGMVFAFEADPENASRIQEHIEANSLKQIAVTLDEFTREHARPDFIKMDIEGGEVEALRGASHVFERIRPLLLLEVHNRGAEEHVRSRLRDWGYCHEWLEPDLARLPHHLMAWPEGR